MSGLREQALERLDHLNETQAHLAHMVGVSEKHLSQVLTGHVSGSLPLWESIAKALGLQLTLAAHPVEPAPVADRQRLAEVLDPAAFNESKPRSKQHAAIVQWAARQHMAYQGADRLLAAGVFRSEAEVKAEALEEAAELRHGITKTRGDAVDKYLRNRAAALRAGDQT